MEIKNKTLEQKAKSSSGDNWKNFNKPAEVNYVLVTRPGWGDVGINGGGDPDSVDYQIA